MSALGAAISGLQSSQKWLDVISNNVSNSQTVAYKQGRLTFSDLISEGLRSPSGPNSTANLGGINPNQLGLGVTVGSVQTIMKQGALQTTGNVSDVAINGTGFLTVAKGSSTVYTRAGNLTFDQQGNLVTTDGGLVQGWTATYTRLPLGGPSPITAVTGPVLDTTNTSAVGNIVIPNNLVLAPKQTTNQTNAAIKTEGVILKGNLDVNTVVNVNPGGYATAGFVPDATSTAVVYDSLGSAHTILFSFEKTALTGAWTMYVNNITGGAVPGAANLLQTVTMTFNTDGSLQTHTTAGLTEPITLPAAALPNGAIAPMVFSVNLGTDDAASATGLGLRDGLTSDYGNGTTDSLGVYTPKQTAYTSFVDGYPEGTLQGISFNQTGGVDARFSNGQTIEVAKLALTKFDNQDGLERVGGNYFQKNSNTGLGQVGTAGSNGFGSVSGGALEASNVDLTVELTNMILAQRMFESNARVVTAADRVLDTLVNLGR